MPVNIRRYIGKWESIYWPAGYIPTFNQCPLRNHCMCVALTTAERKWLAAKTDQMEAAPDEVLYYEGDPAWYFLTIHRGVVRLVRRFRDGRRSIVGFLYEGDYLGSGFVHKTYDATAEAVTSLDYCRISMPRLEALSQRSPGLRRRLAEMVDQRLQAASEHIVLLSRKSALEKVAAFLLAWVERMGGDQLDLPMDRSDIADYLGLTIETVSRAMARLVKNQVIALPTPQHVRVLDKVELGALARPEGDGPYMPG